MSYKILWWNVQGAGSREFLREFRDIVRRNRVAVAALFEPRISGCRADKVIKGCGFQNSFRVEATGFSGGIWVLWQDVVEVRVLECHSQFVDTLITFQDQALRVTMVYAAPSRARRSCLWPELSRIRQSFSGPGIIGGDMNCIAAACEAFGGAVPSISHFELGTWREANELQDIKMVGARFTWARGNIRRRLDRIMGNAKWFDAFPTSTVVALPRIQSDHNPLMTTIGNPLHSFRQNPKIFRFSLTWQRYERFRTIIKDAWGEEGSVYAKLDKIRNETRVWHNTTFGEQALRRNRLRARIAGIERATEWSTNPFLHRLHHQLCEELNALLEMEEIQWIQRSTRNWNLWGDKNSKFYHRFVRNRKRKNWFSALKDEAGTLVDTPLELDHMVLSYFKGIYVGQDSTIPHNALDVLGFPDITEDDRAMLERSPNKTEVWEAIKSMAPLKAPGPDGFHAAFYQHNWATVGDEICRLVCDIFEGTKDVGVYNNTLVVLIPKVPNPTSITQFRPISLLNVLYKAVTKLITNRLTHIMPKCIAEGQASFVKGRVIQDNILACKEISHHLEKSCRKPGYMILKLDLEKAYDKLNWNFIEETLLNANFPPNLTRLLMACVTSSKIQIQWNGSLLEEFKPNRGIRQGDPVSPYLFILCLERLGHMICKATHDKRWKPVAWDRGTIQVPYLFFADDILLFAQATPDQAVLIKHILEQFCQGSGLSISIAKSHVMFGKAVPLATRDRIVSELQIPAVASLGTYLGIPLSVGKRRSSHYNFLLDRMRAKLNGWKCGSLSFAGRTTLVKSVLNTMSCYHMQVMKIPRKVTLGMERICRNFLWGSTSDKRKIHLIDWNTVCLDTNRGGLGIRNLDVLNEALLMKSCWGLLSRSRATWVNILKAKNRWTMNHFRNSRPTCSFFMKAVLRGWQRFSKFVGWRLGNGETTRFWQDKWLGSSSTLAELATATISLDDQARSVHSYVSNGAWNWLELTGKLPEETLNLLASTYPPENGGGEDTPFWIPSPCGRFTVRSAYQALANRGDAIEDKKKWQMVWRWPALQRVRSFLWLVIHGRILTGVERVKRHLSETPSCHRCGGDETILHALRDCPVVRGVWQRLGMGRHDGFAAFDPRCWLEDMQTGGEEWMSIVGTGIWEIWKGRCREIFGAESVNWQTLDKAIITNSKSLKQATTDWNLERRQTWMNKRIKWTKPEEGWIKANCDGCVRNGVGIAGGLLRDEMGSWKGGVFAYVGHCDILQTEAWGILHTLQLAWDLDIKKLQVESDNEEVVRLITGNESGLGFHWPIIDKIKEMRNWRWTINISHIHREANRAADSLVQGSRSIPGTLRLEAPPYHVAEALRNDLDGSPINRRVLM